MGFVSGCWFGSMVAMTSSCGGWYPFSNTLSVKSAEILVKEHVTGFGRLEKRGSRHAG